MPSFYRICGPILLLWLLFTGCDKSEFVTGFLEIEYQLIPGQSEVVPSYQTVIWLEDQRGDYVKSLLVSEYLSYGGYHDSTICPTWQAQVDWDNVPEAEFEAVTRATPPIGMNHLKIELAPIQLPPGNYRFLVETHIQEKYNVLYAGEIELGRKPNESSATVQYVPTEHPLAGEVLRNVKAKYYQ